VAVQFKKIHTTDSAVNMLQSYLKTIFDQLQLNPFLNGERISQVKLVAGVNLVSHGLGRAYKTCLVGLPSAGTILNESASPDRTKYVSVASSGSCTVDLFVL